MGSCRHYGIGTEGSRDDKNNISVIGVSVDEKVMREVNVPLLPGSCCAREVDVDQRG